MNKKLLFNILLIGFLIVINFSHVKAGPVLVDGPWYQFVFREPGSQADACQDWCVPSPSGNSVYADSPPWTFTAPPGGALFTIVDVADSGDIFTVYDFGSEIGTTSSSIDGYSCGQDPAICLQDPNFSQGRFTLAEGNHSITIIAIASPYNNGIAHFRIDTIMHILYIPLILSNTSVMK